MGHVCHGVSLTQEGNPPDRTWRRRVKEWGGVYVRQRDLPSPDLLGGLPDEEVRYASLSDETWVKAVAVRLHSGDFTLGGGLHGPPHALAYPLQTHVLPTPFPCRADVRPVAVAAQG